MSAEPKKRIVLPGAGHTNALIAAWWAKNPIDGCTLTCINDHPVATYSGMLPGVLAGQYDEADIRIDLLSLTKRADAELIIDRAKGLDLDAGTVTISRRRSITFDFLSIGIGSVPAGWGRHNRSPSLIPIKPMQTLVDRLERRIQGIPRNSDGRLAVVGGGPAGVEIALATAERLRHAEREVSITLMTSRRRIADQLNDRSIQCIEQLLATRKIDLVTDGRVVEVTKREVVSADGRRWKADGVIWATGAEAPTLLSTIPLRNDDSGFIATDQFLRSSDPRIFAVGDCATMDQSPSPKAGVYAVRQAPVLWHNLQAAATGRPLRTFKPQAEFMKILNTADGRALLQYRNVAIHSQWCWWLKKWIDGRFMRQLGVRS